MEQKLKRRYNFFAQVLILFAVDVLFLIVIASLFGDGASKISSMYQFGSKGLAITTLLQFLLSSFIIILLKTLLFSEKLLKNMMTVWRAILLLLSILVSIILLIIIFDWFSLDNAYAWAGFFTFFGIGFLVSTLFMIIRTKLESRKYDELLSYYKNQHGGENDNESNLNS